MACLLYALLNPLVSSEVETPLGMVPSPLGISTSLDASGKGRAV